MSKTFTYTFSSPAGSLTVTTGDTTQSITEPSGSIQGYAITSITGTFNGENVTGLFGPSGAYQQEGSEQQDNTIFASSGEGVGTSFDGIDGNGITFTVADGTNYQIYYEQPVGLKYQNFTSTGASIGGGGSAVVQSTNYSTAVCYCAGTLIRTTRGDIPVERLVVGDLVVTASGHHRPIRWLGHRTMDLRQDPRPRETMPVRIAAHAFGQDKPSRDLWVSPGHSICVDVVGEALIPAIALVNGSTIRQIEVDEVTYWHVELDSHDILLAENLPAESYLHTGNRAFFAECAVVDLDAAPDVDPAHRTPMDFCRPLHADGVLVEAIRSRLMTRALTMGWRLDETDPLAQMHLVVDGTRVDPTVRGLSVRFSVVAGATDVWLVSETARPCDVEGRRDGRSLGVCVELLTIDDGFGARSISLADPLLGIGFHDVEDGVRRWTDGRAHLPHALWDGSADGFFLRVDLAKPALPRWVAPAKASILDATAPLLSAVA